MRVPKFPVRGWRTLRFRLTALLVMLVGAAAAVVGVGSAIAVHSFLTARLDTELSMAGSRYALALEHPGTSAAENDGNGDGDGGHDGGATAETATVGQSVGTLGARILHGQVTAVGVVADTNHPITVSAADQAVIAGLQPGGSRTVGLPGLGDYRILVTAGRDSDVLVTGLPEHDIAETTKEVLLVEAVVFLAVVLTAGAAGAVAVRRSLRPLDRVTATALHVSELPMATGQVRFPDRIPTADPLSEAGQVATAVNHMLDQVEAALTARTNGENRLRRFVADASHELRTPLAISRSHTELLADAADDWPTASRESLQAISTGNLRMTRLVEDLLLLARMDAGAPTRQDTIDLSHLTLEAVGDQRVTAPEHHWRLDLPAEPVTVRGDEQHLHQILTNLLTNAATHTPAGTSVTITLRPAPSHPEPGTTPAVRLTVTDDGPGFPPDLLPTITQRFVRADPARNSRGGSGLGLAIVSALVTAHHGTLTAHNTTAGAEVTVTLPAAYSQDVEEPPPAQSPTAEATLQVIQRTSKAFSR